MNVKPLLIVNTVVIAAMLGLSAWIAPSIPDGAQLPVHWNLEGVPDRFGSKWEALLALPAVALALTAIFLLLPHFDPRRKNLEQSAKLWNAAAIGVVLMMGGLHVFMILGANNTVTDVKNYLIVGISALFILLGNYLGKTRSNWFAGVRTPWTMSSDYAWEKTHRWAGRLFVATGVVTLISWLATDAKTAAWIMIALILATTIASVVLSYIFWKQDPGRVELNGDA